MTIRAICISVLEFNGYLDRRSIRRLAERGGTMKRSRKFLIRSRVAIQLAALIWGEITAPFALAYDHPLSDDAVRAAYFIGQDVKGVSAFFSRYQQSLPPGTGSV